MQCEVCGIPATHVVMVLALTTGLGSSHYFCDEHLPIEEE
jgi:hypothetical protein